MITNKEALATVLNGRKYREETPREIILTAKESNLVIVFGASDDLMEFRGAINDEFGCYDGGTAYITGNGLLELCECECKYYEKAKETAIPIEALWDKNEWAWEYKTDIPHATFEIYEDNKPYCKGIVFSLDDIKK